MIDTPVDNADLRSLLASNPVFGPLDDETRTLIGEAMQLRTVPRGEVVIREGAAAEGVYLIVSGRLQIEVSKDDGARVAINEVGRGELIGETALLTDQPRTATVMALRDSHLLFLSAEAFDRIVRPHPTALRLISRAVIDRLMQAIRHGPATTPATAIVVVPLDASQGVSDLGVRLSSALESLIGRVPVIGADDVDSAVGVDSSPLARAMWCDRLEAAHHAVIYAAEPRFPGWTDECLRRADLVLLAAMADGSSNIRPVEDDLRSSEGDMQRRTELVLLHQAGSDSPRDTADWLRRRGRVQRHHHVRVDRPADHDRVARLIAGRAIGVVFSGGGARGIAHIGVVQALVERGIPIDATAGSSIGALIAGAVARGDTLDDLASQLRAAIVDESPLDLTLPTVSLASGGRVTRHLVDAARGLDVEDTWVNFRCVSTNLTRRSLEIHERGPGWAAIRASFSIPGLVPPMHNSAGDVLVDGGILDNLPVASLRAAHPGITVIAVDVSAKREFMSSTTGSSGIVSGWKHVARGLWRRDTGSLTDLPRLLMRLTELGARGDDDRGDLCITPDLTGMSLLDFDKFDRLVDIGERDAATTLDAWLSDAGPPAG